MRNLWKRKSTGKPKMYRCQNCGKLHEELPALTFDAPHYYYILSDADKANIAELTTDTCVIKHEDQIDRFIRAVLFIKIKDYCDELSYGIWVSLSEKSFLDYLESFTSKEHEGTYFGFLASQIEGYEDTLGIHMTVHAVKGTNRPIITPNDNQLDRSLVKDYFEGITLDEAMRE